MLTQTSACFFIKYMKGGGRGMDEGIVSLMPSSTHPLSTVLAFKFPIFRYF
jgi:hypothetical protein